MIRGVLLDFYGTLVEEDEVNLQAITAAIHGSAQEQATLAEVGKFWYDAFFQLTDAAFGEVFRTQAAIGRASLDEAISRFGSTVDAGESFAAQQRYWASPTVYAETVPFLETMQNLGLVTCIVSNADRADVDAALAVHGLVVDHVVTSEDARHYKPHPHIFELAVNMTGLAAGDLVHVGDSWRSDVRGATGVGIQPVWLNRTGREQPDDDHAAHEISDLTSLAHWLREQTGTDRTGVRW
jgi:2-haloacid dehalogenase/putative hydrolase of the HAD superfamily